MDDQVINEICNCIQKYNSTNTEIEFRLGYIEDESKEFDSSISSVFFNKIKDKLDRSSVFLKKEELIHDKFYSYRKQTIRSSNGIFMKKTKLKTINISYEPFDVRVSFSTEEPIKEPKQKKLIFERIKDRKSYFYKDWIFDLTKVTVEENNVSREIYEVELELKNDFKKDDFKKDKFKYLATSALMKIQDLAKICESDSTGTFKLN